MTPSTAILERALHVRDTLRPRYARNLRVAHSMDCVGFVSYCLTGEFDPPGLPVFGLTTGFSDHSLMDRWIKQLGGLPVPLNEAKPADVALFKYAGVPCHMALFLQTSPTFEIIHCSDFFGGVQSHPMVDGDIWQQRFIGAYSFLHNQEIA